MKKRSPQHSDSQKTSVLFPVVGVGASAGGLEAFTQFLKALPKNSGMAFVLVQHLDPKHKSGLTDLLAKTTKLPVHEIEDGVKLQPNHVYVITANSEVTISQASLKLHKRQQTKRPALSINRFLTSLAEDQQQNAIGVILSGTASDGTEGLAAIKQAGGFTFAQDKTATFQGMPESAIQAGVVDFILPPESIVKKLLRIARHLPMLEAKSAPKQQPNVEADQLKEILSLLNQYTNTDLSQYKTSTLNRRIARRLIALNLNDLAEYIAYLKANHKEADALRQDMLINVTCFFRDPQTVRQLQREILPKLTADRASDKPLRLWVAGCATGEEAYSLAIIVQEFLDQHSLDHSVQIFATDLSATAISHARSGQYNKAALKGVSEQRIKRFFNRQGANYQIIKSVRDMCVFAPHNLAADPPFSQLDLVSCCNVLIYLQPALQQRLLRTFHYGLKPAGYLVLGSSETVGSSRALFSPLAKKGKVYVRKEGVTPRLTGSDASVTPSGPSAAVKVMSDSDTSSGGLDIAKEIDSLLMSQYVPACVVIDNDLEIVQFRGATSPYLQPASGKASLNLLKMARPSLSLELRSAIKTVQKSHRAFKKEGLVVKDGETVRKVTIEIMPLSASDNDHLLVIFADTAPDEAAQTAKTASGKQSKAATKANDKDRRIASLEKDQEAAQEEMKRLVDEHDVLNEELQSSNEEIRSSNEELQTLNEELETTGEELQSSNEELITMNQELRTTNYQVSKARHYAEAITQTIREPLIVLGADLRVISANDNFCKTFKVLKKHTEGQLIYKLGNDQWDIPELRKLLEKILLKHTSFNDFEVTHDFLDIGRKSMLLNARQIEDKQLILLAIEDITERQETAKDLKNTADSLRFMAESMPQKVFTAEPNGDIDYFNPQWSEYTGLPFDEIKNLGWTQLIHPDDVDVNVKRWQHSIKSGKLFYLEHRLRRADGKYRWHLNRAQAMRDEQGKIVKWMGSNTDIDELKQNDDIRVRLEVLTKQRNALIKLNKIKSEFTALASHQLRTPATAVKQYISLLIDEYAGEVSADQLQYLQIAYDSNERQLIVIDDLLKTVQLDSNDFKLDKLSQNIVQMVSEAVAQLKPIFELRKQTVVVDASSQDISAVVDGREMKLVLINLLDNASKYTYPGEGIKVRIVQKNHMVQISVSDEGVGISKVDVKRIFDKFTRVDNELSDTVNGTGLGLYWVKRIVKLHKGSVEVVSVPKKGTTFKISLPQ
ncbi:hypothetical protein BH23PAT2_BH23PAT2_00760 [soil metagenome]